MRKNVSPLPNWCSDSTCHVISHRLTHLSSVALLRSFLMHLHTWIMKWTLGWGGGVASCSVNPLCPHGESTCWPILLFPASGQCVGEKLLHFKRITSYSDSMAVRCESYNHLKHHPSWVSETLQGGKDKPVKDEPVSVNGAYLVVDWTETPALERETSSHPSLFTAFSICVILNSTDTIMDGCSHSEKARIHVYSWLNRFVVPLKLMIYNTGSQL